MARPHLLLFIASFTLFLGCKEHSSPQSTLELAQNSGQDAKAQSEKPPKRPLSEEFKNYWYAGNAEITSYKLEQARYGEIRDGHAVLIYVTEPFLPEEQVKADKNGANTISVLKLNSTKKFITGIYPYSIMGSTFYPVHDNQHAIKTSLSVQEWCGHVYSQINNREKFEFVSHSYFEGEADQNRSLEKENLENEIWTKIRINPNGLSVGALKMIPSLEFLRLRHKELKAYAAVAQMTTENGITTYSITYPDLDRTLNINFTSAFPYTVESWSEDFQSGFGPNAKKMTTRATKLKSMKTAYWGQNGNKDQVLRDSLGI
ncbi:MAG: septum formation inhibitor Maf [Allomuricauda sp.]